MDREEPEIRQEKGSGRRSFGKELLSWILTIVIAFFAAKMINEYVLYKAIVPTGSMENNIMTGDQIMGLQIAYLFSEPKRGDIVIFPFPDNPSTTYVKRIIGLPGETVEVRDGSVYIDGMPLREDYLKEEMVGDCGPYEVPEGCYFMMGDNRNISLDARKWQNKFVKEEDIIAKAIFRYQPSFQWYTKVDYE